MSANLRGRKIAIFGGRGFIGSHLVNNLCKEACQIFVVTRNKQVDKNFFYGSEPGQVKFVVIDKYNEININKVVSECDIIFNLVGILAENEESTFNFVHSEIPKLIAASSKKNNVRGLIHVSALNVNKIRTSNYALTKYSGEQRLKNEFPNAVIVRPSVVFGKGDNFVNFFFKISNFSPFLPLLGSPYIDFSNSDVLKIINFKKKVKFQPVYVGDLARFLVRVSDKKNKTYDLAGPVVQSFDEIFNLILSNKKRKRLYFPVPFFAAKILAFFLEKLPSPLLTRDQINLLEYDSVSQKGIQNLKKEIKTPSSIETTIKNFL